MSLLQLLNICDSFVLGFWADPEEDSSGDEDEEREAAKGLTYCLKPRNQETKK